MRLTASRFLPAVYRLGVGVAVLITGFVALKDNRASSFADRPFPEAVEDAPIAVRGRVGMSYANWATGRDGRKRVYTFTELTLDEVLKGDIESRPSIILRSIGGEVDGVGMQVSGAARFNRGEDVVVFLSPASDDGSFEVRSMMMGKLNVVRKDSGEEVLEGPALGGWDRLHAGHQGHGGTGDENAPSEIWTVNKLKELIQAQADDKSAGNPRKTPDSRESEQPSDRHAGTAPGLHITSSSGADSPGGDSHDPAAAPVIEDGRGETGSDPSSDERSRWTWILIGVGTLTLLGISRLLLRRAR